MCLECGKSFISFPSLVEHRRSHVGDAAQPHPRKELYICRECGECFYSFSLFTEHQQSHAKEKTFMVGKGHFLLPWMLPGSPRAVPGPHANSGPVSGEASSPLPHAPLWVPYALPHPTLSGTPFMVPALDPQSYMPIPLTHKSGPLYVHGFSSRVLEPSGSLPREGTGSVVSGTLKEEGAASSRGGFVGEEDASAKVLEDQGGSSLWLNPPPRLDVSQTNHAGQSLFPCLDCGEQLNATLLTLHRRDCKREAVLRCPRCKKRFPSDASLRDHEKVHSGANS